MLCKSSRLYLKLENKHETFIRQISLLSIIRIKSSSARKDKLKDHVKKHHPVKAVEKGWLTEAEAAKVRPTSRHRPKANVIGDGQDTSKKEKMKQQPSQKHPAHFESLVEEILKAHESQQKEEKQKAQLSASENQERFGRTSASLNKPDVEPVSKLQPLQHNSNHTTTTQAQQEPASLKLRIQSITEQSSSQMRHQAPDNQHPVNQEMNSETRLASFHNSVQTQLQPQTSITGGIQNPSGQIQSVIRFEQPLPQAPGTGSAIPDTSHQYGGNIPTSSTLSEEVLQFITYPSHSGRVSANSGQFQAASPMSSCQPQMETVTGPVSNLQQDPNNAQLQYQVQHQGAIPQNTSTVNGNQWS